MECVECGTILTGRQKKWCGESCRKTEGRRQHLWQNFHITPEEYDLISAEQGGVCGICGRGPTGGKHLPLDHEHQNRQSGPIRGLLCYYCNKFIVGARSEEHIIRAAEYIKDPPAKRALGREVVAPGRAKRKRQPRKRKRQ